MSDIPDKLVERMADAIRDLAEVDPTDIGSHFARHWIICAQDIVAQLPKPIDPDLIEARKIASQVAGYISQDSRYLISIGKDDSHQIVQRILEAIKRGRELQKSEDKA